MSNNINVRWPPINPSVRVPSSRRPQPARPHVRPPVRTSVRPYVHLSVRRPLVVRSSSVPSSSFSFVRPSVVCPVVVICPFVPFHPSSVPWSSSSPSDDPSVVASRTTYKNQTLAVQQDLVRELGSECLDLFTRLHMLISYNPEPGLERVLCRNSSLSQPPFLHYTNDTILISVAGISHAIPKKDQRLATLRNPAE